MQKFWIQRGITNASSRVPAELTPGRAAMITGRIPNPERRFRQIQLCRQPGAILCPCNRTEPKTVGQWIRYVVVAAIALFLVWWMLRLYVL